MFIVMPMGTSPIYLFNHTSVEYIHKYTCLRAYIFFSYVVKKVMRDRLGTDTPSFKDDGGVTAVDFNVGKSDRSGIKVTGKRKKVSFCFLAKTYLENLMD